MRDSGLHEYSRSVSWPDVVKGVSNQGLGQVFLFVFCVPSVCSVLFPFMVVSASAIDCLEKLVSEMIYYVSNGTLTPTHSLFYSLPVSIR